MSSSYDSKKVSTSTVLQHFWENVGSCIGIPAKFRVKNPNPTLPVKIWLYATLNL